jgi:dihydroorotate dehydrogenase
VFSYGLIRPVLFCLDPERTHRIAIRTLKLGLAGKAPVDEDPILRSTVWGLRFTNPIGLAAGFDKDAEVFDCALDLGFGFVEAGSVTPRPQPGNPRPRLFRLVDDEAVINRFGFNSRGLDFFVEGLKRRRRASGIVGANVGKNKDTENAAADYALGIAAVAGLVDYIVCNVSSPNTPGLRDLQARAQIEGLITEVLRARRQAVRERSSTPPLLVKVGPDLTDEEVRDIAEVALRTGVDGLIVGNTTVDRPASLRSRLRQEGGGLSGRPLLAKANACLAAMYRHTEGRIPIVGCGGVATGADAYAKIRAGASLVQLYSVLVYRGPGVIHTIKRELAQCLRRDGFSTVAEAVGADRGSASR